MAEISAINQSKDNPHQIFSLGKHSKRFILEINMTNLVYILGIGSTFAPDRGGLFLLVLLLCMRRSATDMKLLISG